MVAKLQIIESNQHNYDEYIQITDHDAVQLLKYYIPSFSTIYLVKSHQDKRKKKHKLNTVELLTTKVDKIIEAKVETLINNHIDTAIVIYINNIYYILSLFVLIMEKMTPNYS